MTKPKPKPKLTIRFTPPPTTEQLRAAYDAMLEADRLYTIQPTPERNQDIVRKQTRYYALLRRTNPYYTDRGRILHQRAIQNGKRLKDDAAWQALAKHQARYTMQVKHRCEALALLEPTLAKPQPTPTTPNKPPRKHPPKPAKRIRYRTLTGRYAYREPEGQQP